MTCHKKRYNDLNTHLKKKFGERIYKVSLHTGMPCPNLIGANQGCSYCNFHAYTTINALESPLQKISITNQLNDGIDYIRKRHSADKCIAYFQNGSNTYGNHTWLKNIYEQSIAHPNIVGLAISTRPDCLSDQILDILEDINTRTFLWIELGLQSAHNTTLHYINRGHDTDCFIAACNQLHQRNIRFCPHIILGLPNETIHMMKQTAQLLNSVNSWGVKIHNLHILKNTTLAKQYGKQPFHIPSINEYANWVIDLLEILSPQMIIHRLNSHGPRQLTLSPLWSINKLATINEIENEFRKRNTWQARLYSYK